MQWALPPSLLSLLFASSCLAAPPEPFYTLATAQSARLSSHPVSYPPNTLTRSHSAPSLDRPVQPVLVRATRPHIEADLVRARKLLQELHAGPGVHILQERQRLREALARRLERLRRRLYLPELVRDRAAGDRGAKERGGVKAASAMKDLFGAYLNLELRAQAEVPGMVAQVRRQRGKDG